MLITTDACVKALEEDSNVSLSLTLLVNYDLPGKRVRTVCVLLCSVNMFYMTISY